MFITFVVDLLVLTLHNFLYTFEHRMMDILHFIEILIKTCVQYLKKKNSQPKTNAVAYDTMGKIPVE